MTHVPKKQKPAPANQQPGTTSKHEETLTRAAKVKPTPAHVGHANPHPAIQEGDGVHNGVPTAKNRNFSHPKAK
jgi:hypothetical protein